MDLELFFIIRKCCIKYVSFYHGVGRDSIIFYTKHFEQKHVLTGCILFTMETWPIQYENLLWKVKFPDILCIKSLDSMQHIKCISDFFYRVSILTPVDSWLDKITHLLSLIRWKYNSIFCDNFEKNAASPSNIISILLNFKKNKSWYFCPLQS